LLVRAISAADALALKLLGSFVCASCSAALVVQLCRKLLNNLVDLVCV
jgi:hypothetical protein